MKPFSRWVLVVAGLTIPFAAQAKKAKAAEPSTQTEVTCRDGTTGKAGRGACSHHGGVSNPEPMSAQGAAAPAPAEHQAKSVEKSRRQDPGAVGRAPGFTKPMPNPKDQATGGSGKPTAQCKDGTFSYSAHHTGACSHHGGVTQWIKP
jgi:hypothetical protein